MELKVGEIQQVNGEWYQCLKGDSCKECAFFDKPCNDKDLILGECLYLERSDRTSVIFKKLEKVGEPFALGCGKWMQKYTCFMMRSKPSNLYSYYDSNGKFINIEIK